LKYEIYVLDSRYPQDRKRYIQFKGKKARKTIYIRESSKHIVLSNTKPTGHPKA